MRVLRLLLFVVGAGALAGLVLPALVAGDAPVTMSAATPSPLTLGTMATPSPSPEETRAIGMLRRAAAAGRERTYSGTQYVTSWSRTGTTSVVVQLQHVPGEGMLVQLEGSPAGRGSAGSQKSAVTSAVVDDPATTDFDPRVLSALERHYALKPAGVGQCAGRPCQTLEVHRRDDGRLAGRLWLDQSTGLLLRRELYDLSGRTVRAAAFVDLQLSAPRSYAAAKSTAAAPDGNRLDVADLRRLRHQGWQVPESLPGGLELYDARMRHDGAHGERVLHLSYSDGLFTVSVFAQSGRLDTSQFSGWQRTTMAGATVYTRPGLTQRLVWSGGDAVYTVVADAPDGDLERVVASLPHRVSSDGFLDRVGRGLSRMGSWVS